MGVLRMIGLNKTIAQRKFIVEQLNRWSRVCTNCGKEADHQAHFCRRCGSKKLSLPQGYGNP
jgi:rRNA maturation endonuclease Nob1